MRAIFFISFFISSFCFSQNEEIIIPIEGKLLFSGQSIMIPASNEEVAGFSIIKINENNIEAFQFDENEKYINKITTEIPKRLISFLSAIKLENSIRLFFSSFDGIGYLDIDFKTNIINTTIIKRENNFNEKVIGYFGKNSKFYLVTIDEESLIRVLMFSENEAYKTTVFTEEAKQLNETNLFQKLLKTKEVISIIKENEQASITLSYKTKKIYVSENNIIITVDNKAVLSDAITLIVSLNLKTKNLDVYNIPSPKLNSLDQSKNKIIIHSFVKGNLLFQFSTNKDDVAFQIVDFKNKEVIKKFEFSNSSLEMFNAPLEYNIPEFGYKKPERISKIARFYKNLYSKKAGIVVFENENNYTIRISTLDVPARNKRMHLEDPVNMVEAFTPLTTTSSYVGGELYFGINYYSGVITNPPNYGTTNSIYQNEKITTENSIILTVNKNDFSVVLNENYNSIYKKTRKFEQGIRDNKVRLVKPSLFKIKNEYYFSYFSIKNRSFLISKIK